MLHGLTTTVTRGIVWPFRVIAHSVSWIYRSIINGVSWTVRTVVHAITSTVRAVVNGIIATVTAIVNAIKSAALAIVHGIVQTVLAVVHSITWTYRTITHGIAQTVLAVVHSIVWTYRTITHGIVQGVLGVVHAIAWTYRTITRGIAQFIRTVVNAITNAGRRAAAAYGSFAQSMRGHTLTLSLDDGGARLVIFHGNQVVAWDQGRWDSPSDEAESEASPMARGAAHLRELLAELKIRRGRMVTDLPLYAPLVRQFQLPKVSGRYLEPMVVSEVLDTIPFAREEVDISWRSDKRREGQDILAVAVPRQRVDSQVRFAKDAGLPPKAAYSKASALALATGLSDVILVHLEPGETGLVLVAGGSPKVVHQLDLKQLDDEPSKWVDVLGRAVEQVAGYYQSLDSEADSEALPVVLTGQFSNNASLPATLSKVLNRPVLPFAPSMECPPDFPATEYASNLGLYLADQAKGASSGKGEVPMGPCLNLLPERHLPQSLLPIKAFFTFVVLVLLTIPVFPAAGQVEAAVQDAEQLASELAVMEREVIQHRKAGSLERRTNERVERNTKQTADLNLRLDQLASEMEMTISRLVAITDTALPRDVQLESLAPEALGLGLSGGADSYAAVLQYAVNLQDSSLFSNATVQHAKGSSQEGIEGGLKFGILAEPVKSPRSKSPVEGTKTPASSK
ncbi:MAG: PilN domain-containing protein [Chloroflexi bacterium]|nr:PilN domain-containing protein [Chloroflexota bacterium]MCH8348683.1 PilN domain-containing protein [Chloroflexota bacterium]